MFQRATVLVLILACGLGALRAGEDEAAQKLADAELHRLVGLAINRGAKWLLARQHSDGSFSSYYASNYPMGATALATLALLHSGVPRESAAIRNAFTLLRRIYGRLVGSGGSSGSGLRTYSISVTVMALAELGRDRRTVRAHDEKYGGAAAAGFQLREPDLEWMQQMTDWLVKVQQTSGAWRYPEGGGYDHSNSQYALLALKEARRSGLEVPDRTFMKALQHFLDAQESSGKKVNRYQETAGDGVYGAQRERIPGYDRARGWGYVGKGGATGSMTTAGVAAAAVCTSELRDPRYRGLVGRGLQGLRDGLAWLGENFSVTMNPTKLNPSVLWHYYYLYGLERAGVLGGVVHMGDHRWYAEGARYLVNAQGPDGAWRTRPFRQRIPGGAAGADPVDHSFALLFLTRATARALGVATEDPLLDLTGGAELSDGDLENLLAAALQELDRLTEERAADRARDFAFLGPRILPKLLIRLHAEEEKVRAQGARILRAVTGLSFGYDAAAPPAERERTANAWTVWYLTNQSRLSLDRTARRIR